MTATPAFDRLKVLIVDDQNFVRAVLRKMLNQLGVTDIDEARDGDTALAATGRDRPDLVICDLRMRPRDGFGLVTALRAAPETAALPVILLSGHVDAAIEAEAGRVGVDAVLAKPVLIPALKETIVRVIAARERTAP